ncbi:sarcosine oxidase subunit gamma family protein [Fodinicurvata sp. EGI_FJ10296]|uniref:sarcosine oxidase subunit gamma n=1 Tax=Fodinicurvata sp. EGI_FJ10296 TaxID=3231908 RepID=UPI003451142D
MLENASRPTPPSAAAPSSRRTPLDHVAAVGSAADAAVTLAERPHIAKISLRGRPSDAQFMAAAGRVLDMVLPTDPLSSVGTTGSYGTVAALNLGPDEWLITADPGVERNLTPALSDAFDGIHAAVVDVTENSTVLRLAGGRARDTLAKGMPLDIHDSRFPVGAVAQSLIAKADVILHRQEDSTGAPVFDIHVRRSFAAYLWQWLCDAGGEYGVATVRAQRAAGAT